MMRRGEGGGHRNFSFVNSVIFIFPFKINNSKQVSSPYRNFLYLNSNYCPALRLPLLY